MSQAGRITFDELEIPQAIDATFSKDGGFTSVGSVGADRVITYVRDGGIQSEFATDELWRDNFERSATNSFGTADLGGAYTTSGASTGFSVSGGLGRINGNDNYYAYVPVSAMWGEVSGKVALSAVPTGTVIAFDLLFRLIDTANWYRGSIRFQTTGRVDVQVDKFIASTQTILAGPATQISTGGYTAGAWLRFKARVRGLSSGPRIEIKIWLDGNSEPDWATGSLAGTDTSTSLPNAGKLGFRAATVGVTNSPEVRVDEILFKRDNTATGGPITAITKSGGFASPGSLGGTRAHAYAKSGGESSPGAVGPGAQTRQYIKSAGIVSIGAFGGAQQSPKVAGIISPGSLGGSKAASFLKLGGISTAGKLGTGQRGWLLWDQFVIPQASATTFAKSGGIISPGSVGLFRNLVNIFARQGGIQSSGSVGATKLVNLWDDWSLVRSYAISTAPAKTGGIIGPVTLGGARAQQYNKTGGIQSPGSVGGTRRHTEAKDSGIESAGSLGGDKGVQSLTSKSGGFSSTGSLGASKGFSASKVAGTLSVGSVGASKAYTADKTGGIVGRISFIGDVAVNSEFNKQGGFQIPWSSSGPDFVIFSKNGGFAGAVNLGAAETYKRGGIQSAGSLGGSRAQSHTKTGGIVSTWSSTAAKFVTFTKDAVGIESAGKVGADQANTYPRDGGFISQGELGGTKFVPLRTYPVAGGIVSAGSTGATFTKFLPKFGGFRSTAVFGERPTVGIRSVGRLGGFVSVQMLIPPGGEKQIISVFIGDTRLLSTEDLDETILIGSKL